MSVDSVVTADPLPEPGELPGRVAERRRLDFLGQVGEVLTATADYRATLGNLARLAVPELADVCVVSLLQADGSLLREAFAAIDPNPLGPLPEPPEPTPRDAQSGGLWSVVTTCRSELYNSIPDGLIERHVAGHAARERYVRAGIVSAMLVPIPIGGRALGALTFLSFDTSRRFTALDLVSAEEIGRLCAVALAHGLLHADARGELSERRLTEARLRRQSEQQAVVAGLGNLALTDGDIPAFLSATSEALARTLALDLIAVAEFNPEHTTLTLRAQVGHREPVGTVGSFPDSARLAEYSLAVGTTVLVDDLHSETRFAPGEGLLQTGMRSALCAPIILGTRTQGILYGLSSVARRFTSEDKHFIEAVANVIAGAWGRAAAAAALVAEKEHLAVTLRSIGDGVISTDTDGRGASAPRWAGRILVMDDEDLVRETLTRLLESLGFEVTGTEDGEQAVDAWRAALAEGAPYACVVLDLTVPGGVGGLLALRSLLALDPTVRAIVSSGYSEDPVMSEPAAYGFTDVLSKPYTLSELASVLGRVVPHPPHASGHPPGPPKVGVLP